MREQFEKYFKYRWENHKNYIFCEEFSEIHDNLPLGTYNNLLMGFMF